MRIFENYNYDVSGKIISKSSFKALSFLQKSELKKEKLGKVIEKAKIDLTAEIPSLTLSKSFST